MHVGPLVSHPICDLNLQRRIRDARVDAIARSVQRSARGGRRSLLDRVRRRGRADRAPLAIDAAVLGVAGEDVEKAFRF
jgi:hypothetical protein